MDLRRRVYFLLPAAVAALLQNALHEGVHYLAATAWGEEVLEFRFLTNGWLTSQVVYATPVAQRSGLHWLAIAWLPALATTGIGYLLFASRRHLLTNQPRVNAFLWYLGVFFLLIDPLYFAVLSLFVGGDLGAVDVVGWNPWTVRLPAVGVLLFNFRLVMRWRREASAQPERYLAKRGTTSR